VSKIAVDNESIFSGGIGVQLNKILLDYNKITEQDLIQLEKIKKQKIILTKDFVNYKVGDILEVKFFPNLLRSEPPSFLVIDEKLGSPKYGFGGRGSTPFYEIYKEKEKEKIADVNSSPQPKVMPQPKVIPLMWLPAPITEAVKQQNLKMRDTLTAEDKFYEKLGIKYHNTHMFGRPSRRKGRLLVALALVAGYFAYKKFKK
jgi:hypothetical protein